MKWILEVLDRVRDGDLAARVSLIFLAGEGLDGKVWKIRLLGRFGLMTVPHWLAIEPGSLPLPEDVIKADGL